MTITPKMHAARKTMAQRFHSGAGKECMTILDRQRFVCTVDPVLALRLLPGFRVGRSYFPRRGNSAWFKPYGHAQWFHSEKSKMQLYLESDRQNGWLAPYSVTLIADDRTGLLAEEVIRILAAMPTARLTMIELAFDFSPATNVTQSFVLKHGVFGKSWRDLSTTNSVGHWWGAKKGGKRVKSYFKDEICGHRVELMMRSRFLNHYGIRSVYDFRRFVDLLPTHHVWFARLDEGKLIERVRGGGLSAEKTLRILRVIRKEREDLSKVLGYLRRDVGLKNVRRLLVPLPENLLVLDALNEWAAKWPAAPARVRRKNDRGSQLQHPTLIESERK